MRVRDRLIPPVLTEMRRRRLSRVNDRRGRFESFYRVYITLFCAGLVIAFAQASAVAHPRGVLTREGAGFFVSLLALTCCLSVSAGFRVGTSGGPLVVPRPDIHHVLLAPLERRSALFPTALEQFSRGSLFSLAAGATTGLFVGNGARGGSAAWAVSLGVFGALCYLLFAGVALLVAVQDVPFRRAGRIFVTGLTAAGVLGVLAESSFVPLTAVALWPRDRSSLASLGALPLALLVPAFAGIGRLSLELMDRRGTMSRSARLALVQRDYRAFVILRRRLQGELPRRRPWIGWRMRLGAVTSRDVNGLRRTPASRLSRLTWSVIVAGLCLAVADGEIFLVGVAGVLHFLVGVELVEGFAQEIDHPDLSASHPLRPSTLVLRHAVVPTVCAVALASLSTIGVPALADLILADVSGSVMSARTAIAAVLAGSAAILGASFGMIEGKPLTAPGMVGLPEVSFVGVAMRAFAAPAISVAGLLPLLALSNPLTLRSTTWGFRSVALALGIAEVGAFVWLGVRESARSWWGRQLARWIGPPAARTELPRDTVPLARIQASRLRKEYDEVPVLEGVNLVVHAGEVLALLGPNGAGKSTFLRLCAGLLVQSGGGLSVAGGSPDSKEARRAVAYVPDVPVFYDDLSVWEHAEFINRLRGRDDWEAVVRSLLERFALDDRIDDLPTTFSRGMQQKAALVLGLGRPSEILLLDEPFASLDRSSRQELVSLLREAKGSDQTVVVAGHDDEIFEVATRFIALRGGRVVYDGPSVDEAQRSMS